MPNPSRTPAGPTAPATRRQRALAPVRSLRRLPGWVQAHRLPAAVLAAAVMAPPLIATALLLSSRPSRPISPEPTPLEQALAAFDRGEYAQAGRMAAALAKEKFPADQAYAVPLLAGAAASARAEDLWGPDQARYYALAARYLTEADERGIDERRRGTALLLLGRSQALAGQHAASIRALEAALPLVPSRAAEIHHLLAQAMARDPHQFSQAIDHYTAYLAEATLSRAARDAVLVEIADLQERSGEVEGCRQTLEQLGSTSTHRAQVLLLRGRLLMRDAAAASSKSIYQQAIDALRESQRQDTLAQRVTPPARLLISRCYLALGDDAAALEALAQLADKHAHTPEALAGGVDRADLLRRMERDSEALDAWRETLAAVGDPKVFDNPWLTVDALRTRLLAACDDWATRQRYEAAVELTGLMPPVVAEERAVLLAAQLNGTWAGRLQEQASRVPPSQRGAVAEQARRRWREAGRAWLRLAQRRFASRNYPEDIWHAGDSFLAGQDLARAEAAFREYLKIEARPRRPQVLAALAESLLAQGRADEALIVLQECLEIDRSDAATYQARLLAAQGWSEMGDLQRAEVLLRENLEGDLLTPASKEWRESLLALGRLLHADRRFEAAIGRLEEFVARYGQEPATLEARYLLAESYRQSMAEALARRDAENVVEEQQRADQQAQQWCKSALSAYEALIAELSRRQEAEPLPAAEQQMLRNCCFGRGTVLFLAGRYEDAASAYLTAANRFQDSPEVLEAYVQVAACYRRLGRAQDARGVLLQAKALLGQMPADTVFTASTNYNRDEWLALLDSLTSL